MSILEDLDEIDRILKEEDTSRYVYQSDDLKSYMIATSQEEAEKLAQKILRSLAP